MTMIQIRNVPEDVHRALKARAATAGMSLSDYLRKEIEAIARRPTLEDVLARVAAHEPVELPQAAADLVARGRR